MKRILCLLSVLTAGSLAVAEPAATNAPAAKSEVAMIPDATHQPVQITNTVTIAGERVFYTAETGMLPVLKADGTSRASVFYVAYTRQDVTNPAARPVTFCFNGGPGSASVFLHLGALGPRRAKMNPDGSQPAPPFALVDNEYSVLNASDLVFIDPVATGFSRVTKDEKADDFFGDSADLDSVGEFIRLWTTRHERWLSPKYLVRRKLRRVPRGRPGGSPARALRHVFERAGAGFRRAGFCDHQRRHGQRPAVSIDSAGLHGGGVSTTKNCRRICRRTWTRHWPSRAGLPRANTRLRCWPARNCRRKHGKKSWRNCRG